MNLRAGKNKLVKAREKTTRKIRIKHLVVIVLTGLGFLLICSIIVLASVPPVSKDALTHHLAIPKLYIKHQGIYEIPFMEFSYYPMNLDLLYLIPLYFGNDIAPKFIHFSFALLTAWLIFYYLRSRINLIYALLGAIFFLSIPIIVKLSITVYVDLGLIFFTTSALILLLRWIESGFQIRLLIISAIFCGLALGTKYTGLVTLFLLTLFVPFFYSRYKHAMQRRSFKAAGYGALFLIIALLVFSPWMIRNYHWRHNPIYPFYDKWFNPPDGVSRIAVLQIDNDRSSVGLFTYRNIVYQETWWQITLLPIRVFFQGKDGSPQYFDGKLNPFLLFLPIFAFFRIREDPQGLRREKLILLVFAILFFALAFFSRDLRIRYISPIIPPLVILSVFSIRKLIEILRKFESKSARNTGFAALSLILAFAFSWNAYYLLDQYRYVDPFNYLDGTLSRDDYINKYCLEYPVLRYINENLPMDSKIMFIFIGNRGYYCDREYIFDMLRNRSTLRQLIKTSDNPEKILEGLKEIGVTHLLIHYDIFNRWVEENFNSGDKQLLKKFFKRYIKLMFFKNGYGVSLLDDIKS